MIAAVLFAASGLTLAYVYRGYLVALRILGRLVGRPDALVSHPAARLTDGDLPGVTVYISAYNEVDRIAGRLTNLFEQDFPSDRMQILVISDGSTDGTGEAVRSVAAQSRDRDVGLIEFERNQGRAVAQNMVAREAKYDVLLSTDAETVFERSCVRRLVEPFIDDSVAVTGGRVIYRDVDSDVSTSIDDYWSYELDVRRAEQALGVLTKVSGPCVAYRREIWEEIEDFEDVDRVAVFFARRRGLRSLHVDDAICFDEPNREWRQEIRVRRRMTRKGLLTVFHRWRWRDVLGDPLFTLALYSHQVARYPTPLYLTVALGSGLTLLGRVVGWGVSGLVAALLLLILAVGRAADFGPLVWLTARSKSFLAANLGFAWGWLDVLVGNTEGRYRPTRRLTAGGEEDLRRDDPPDPPERAELE